MTRKKPLIAIVCYCLIYTMFTVIDVDGYLFLNLKIHQLFNYLTYVALGFWGFCLFRKDFKEYQSEFASHLKKSFLILGSLGVIQVLLNGLAYGFVHFLLKLLHIVDTGLQNDAKIAESLGLFPVWTSLLVIGFMGPLVEELIYRRLLLTISKKYLPVFLSVLLQALVFAFLHINALTALEIIHVIPRFLTGLLFGYAYHKTGNLIYPLTIHSIINIMAVLMQLILL